MRQLSAFRGSNLVSESQLRSIDNYTDTGGIHFLLITEWRGRRSTCDVASFNGALSPARAAPRPPGGFYPRIIGLAGPKWIANRAGRINIGLVHHQAHQILTTSNLSDFCASSAAVCQP